MNRYKQTVLAILVGAGIILSGTATAFGPHSGQRPGPIARIINHATELGLSSDQIAALELASADAKSQIGPLRREARDNRKQIDALSESGSYDPAELQALAAAGGDLHAQMMIKRVQARENVRAILTDEQLQMIDERRRMRAGKRGGPRKF